MCPFFEVKCVMDLILQHYKQLNREADSLKDLSRKVRALEDDLATNWTGVESKSFCEELKEVEYMLRKVNDEMVEFGHDYLKIGELNEVQK